jgi:hypothetical protein
MYAIQAKERMKSAIAIENSTFTRRKPSASAESRQAAALGRLRRKHKTVTLRE